MKANASEREAVYSIDGTTGTRRKYQATSMAYML